MHSERRTTRLPSRLLLALALAAACQGEPSQVAPEPTAGATVASATPAATTSGKSGPETTTSASARVASAEPSPATSGSASGSAAPVARGDDGDTPAAKGKKGKKKRKKDRAAASHAVGPGAVGRGPAPQVKLLDAGKAPRKKLRIVVKKGQKERLLMTTSVGMKVLIDGKPGPSQPLPSMQMAMDLTVTDVSAGGDIRYDFVLTEAKAKADPKLPAATLSAIQKGLSELQGLSGYALVTSRGVQKAAKLNIPASVRPEARQLMQSLENGMNQVMAPLPSEPVGVGARWQYGTKVSQNGITLGQLAVYELTKMEADSITCKVTVAQNAPKQRVMSPVGVAVELQKLTSSGSGTTWIRLERLAPKRSHVAVSTTVDMGLPNNKTMAMTTNVTVDIESP